MMDVIWAQGKKTFIGDGGCEGSFTTFIENNLFKFDFCFRDPQGIFYYYAPYYGVDSVIDDEINPCAYIPDGLNPNDSMRNSSRCTCSSKALFDGFGYNSECPVHKEKL